MKYVEGKTSQVKLEAKTQALDLESEKLSGRFAWELAQDRETANLLKEDNEFANVLLENSPNPIFVTDLDTSIKYVNSALENLTGFTRVELIGEKSPYPWWTGDNIAQFERENIAASSKEFSILERCHRNKNGERFWISSHIRTIRDRGGVKCYLANWVDITERKIAEERIRESERRYRLLAENSSDLIWTVDIDNPEVVTFISPSVTRLLGYSVEEAISKRMEEVFTPESFRIAMAAFAEAMTEEMLARIAPFHSKKLELQLKHKEGYEVCFEVNFSLIRESNGQPVSVLAVARDITERKQAEQALRENEAKYRSLVETASAGIACYNLEGRITFANNTLCSMTGYSPDELQDKPIADFIFQEDLPVIMARFSNAKLGILTRTDVEFRVLCKNHRFLWLHTNAKPITIGGEIAGFSAVLQDITERRNAEESLAQSLDKLQRALQGSIDAAAKMVEMRDPYTAGHQQKVTRLSKAIAQEMNMPDEQVKYLGMAAMVHDIGKIYVPAEILSRTGTLSKLEFEMMKTHVQGGYDILKTIEFPGPIAEIVFQHHERMNGSGYPNGTEGTDILMEARILGVADTVEAMSTHRPYRPALGIKEALAEISRNKNTLYDAAVVDACIELFKKKGFKF